ncbi:hypothetical protein [Cupriavidus sp. TMH.W2]|uniref:hypothetical protein n=1 Tax=Cupriavidus sp. TMH.W2 TaxID=3434465 RepID=UPI003D7853B8
MTTMNEPNHAAVIDREVLQRIATAELDAPSDAPQSDGAELVRIMLRMARAQASALLAGPCGWVRTHQNAGETVRSFTDKREHYAEWAARGVALTPVFEHAPASTAASWLTLADGVPANGAEVWIHTTWGKVEGARKAWKQGHTGDYFETDGAGELAMSDVRHWMPRVKPLPPR